MTTKPLPPQHPGLDTLLGVSADPHPRKTRRVEWIGEKSPLDEPVIALNLLMGRYTPMQERAIRRAAQKVRSRSFGSRLIEHDHRHAQAVVKGMHRTYIFERKTQYVCEMDFSDVDTLLSSTIAHEFVDVTERDPDEPSALVLPPSDPIGEILAIKHTERVARTERVGVGPQRGELVASHR